jgi:membrane protein DedA with SNARE-associated domain/membrane-associated phospholipid phosphatase
MPDVADAILSLHGWVVLLVVFALPALESSAFVGFIFPGEIAVLLGGVLASEGKVPLAAVMAVAVAGAVLGDTVGYAVGRRWGERILGGALRKFIRERHVERGKDYLARRGGRAVFFGRFTAALRVLVPGLAGMSGVSYGRFLVFNIAGGSIWATGFVLIGYGAGESWRQFEAIAKRAGLVLLLIIAAVALTVAVARWVAGHPEWVRRVRQRVRGWPPAARVLDRYERQVRFLSRRFRPESVFGLSLTVSLLLVVILGVAFALLLRTVLGMQAITMVDQPVHRFFVENHDPTLTRVMQAVSDAGSWVVLVPLTIAVGLAWFVWRRRTRPLVVLTGAFLGAYALSHLVAIVVARPRPPDTTFSGFAFPSAHVAQAVAVYGAVAALLAAQTRQWSLKVTAWAAAFLVGSAVGLARLYLGVHWLTDTVGGAILGLVWLELLLLMARTAGGLRRQERVDGPMVSASRM